MAIRLTEDMYEAIVEELGHRGVSRELRKALGRTVPIELRRPWPEREYVLGCPRGVFAELHAHLEKALRRTGGVRLGALSRALVRLADADSSE